MDTNLPLERIVNKIFVIRGMKVMLDSDLAELYGVETKQLNQAVKRNVLRFPDDFMFRLYTNEVDLMNRSQIVTGSRKHRDPKYTPYAFTEHGVAMLSSVLKSKKAVEMNILIIRAFIKLRELLASNKDLSQKVAAIEGEQKMQNRHINSIYRILERFIEEPVKVKSKIGF